MLDKLKGNMMQQMQQIKEKLNDKFLTGDADGVKVTVNGNRVVTAIDIDEKLLAPEHKEELEDKMIIAMNRALKEAEQVWEGEIKGVAGGLLGGALPF
jgi:DNA-binding protein YbaB